MRKKPFKKKLVKNALQQPLTKAGEKRFTSKKALRRSRTFPKAFYAQRKKAFKENE